MNIPVVAIVGRPNVGKSTFFNRMVGRRMAVVDDTPGITRDRLAAKVDWNGLEFHLIDTGGWVPDAEERMDDAILDQVLAAMEACDQILFLVDARQGLHPHDQLIAREIFKRGVPALLGVNKTDHVRLDADAYEFAELGFDQLFPFSAQEGRGTGDLLDELVDRLRDPDAPKGKGSRTGVGAEEGVRVAILGRPNVGKSSLVNRLLGETRMIVDERPGTTRDSVDSPLRYHGQDLVLIDTAGIRRRLGSQPRYEFYAMLRAIRALDRANVAVLVLDATMPIHRQDARIASQIEQSGAAMVIAVNKWDLLKKESQTLGEWVRKVQDSLPFLRYVPIVFISAETAQRIHKLPETIVRVYEAARVENPTSRWNEVLAKALEHNPPRSKGGGVRPVKIYYAAQIKSGPPTVALFVSDPKRIAPDYLRYLAGRFREAFGYEGSPIRLLPRKS